MKKYTSPSAGTDRGAGKAFRHRAVSYTHLEKEPEGGERCLRCYELRLREAASMAARLGYDYFTTTLTISPLKRADKLNEIGERLAAEYGVA